MNLNIRLSIEGRLIVGLLLVGALAFGTQNDDLKDPSNVRLRLMNLIPIGVIAFLSALLVQTFLRRFDIVEFLVIMAIVGVLAGILMPVVKPDHSRRNWLASAVRPMPAE